MFNQFSKVSTVRPSWKCCLHNYFSFALLKSGYTFQRWISWNEQVSVARHNCMGLVTTSLKLNQ